MGIKKLGVGLVLMMILLIVWADLGRAQTVSLGETRVAVGAASTVPITLSSASRGLSDFEIRVSLANGDVADIELVFLPAAFNKYAEVRLSQDHNSVTISTSDEDHFVEAGSGKVELAWIKLRGAFQGTSAIIVAVNRLDDDHGNPINPATETGRVTVTGGPDFSHPEVIGGSDGVLVNAVVDIPIILSSAPNGLSGYRLTVELEPKDPADIEAVYFVAFDGDAKVDIAYDHNSVSFSASDVDNQVEPGAVGVILARVVVRGVLPGSTMLEVTINRMQDEQKATAASKAQDGRVVVSQLLDPPPAFTDERPLPGSTIAVDQPTVSVKITDIGGGVRPETIALHVTDSGGQSAVFIRESAGALWDGEQFSISLAQAGFTLADGWTVVEVEAEDEQGHLGYASWRFRVSAGGSPPSPPPVPPAGLVCQYAGEDMIIDGADLIKAIQDYARGEINGADLIQIIQYYATGTMCDQSLSDAGAAATCPLPFAMELG